MKLKVFHSLQMGVGMEDTGEKLNVEATSALPRSQICEEFLISQAWVCLHT